MRPRDFKAPSQCIFIPDGLYRVHNRPAPFSALRRGLRVCGALRAVLAARFALLNLMFSLPHNMSNSAGQKKKMPGKSSLPGFVALRINIYLDSFAKVTS